MLLAACFILQGVEGRTWTNDTGVTVDAELMAAREREVVLKIRDGSLVTVQRNVLSAEDEQYVVEWIAQKGPDADPPLPSGTPSARMGDAWSGPWPKSVTVGTVQVTIRQQRQDFAQYQTDHFVFESDRPLLEVELKRLAGEMETCLAALAALPLNLTLASKPERKYTVRVFFDKEGYDRAGGETGTRVSTQQTYLPVLLERSSRGVPRHLSRLDAMHATTHWVAQFMGEDFWLNEGLARYMELSTRDGNRVLLNNDLNRVALSVPRIYRRGWEAFPPLPDVLRSHTGKSSAAMNAAVLTVATYFFRFDGEGDGAKIKAYIKAIQDGEKDQAKLDSILLGSRSWQELEKDILHAWRKYMTPAFARQATR